MGIEEYKSIILMIGIQFLQATNTLLARAALLEEMSATVLVVYRQCIGFLLVFPFAYFSRNGTNGGCLNCKSFWSIFLLSLVGVTANQNTNYMAMSLVSSSMASAMYNLAPAITFVLAYTLGLEKVDVRRWGSMAKIAGTAVCISGAAALALFKGPKLLNMETNHDLIQNSQGHDNTWLIGCLLAFGSVWFWSIALIMQVSTNKKHPDLVSLAAWMCLMAAFQSGILGLLLEPNFESWKLNSPLKIFVCFYAGMVSAFAVLGQAWCVSKSGPLFSAMFQPLCTLVVTLLGCLFLHEDLYLGSLIGGVAVVGGLYIVLWGKGKDYKEVKEETPQIFDHCNIGFNEPLLK